MMRLGVLYPPCGAEFEYYRYGERLSHSISVALMGVRIYGEDHEHAPAHLRETARIDNLLLSARVLKHLDPDMAVWACTSGSFIDGLQHARAQVEALSDFLECPATSTSLAFTAALAHLDIRKVSILASYPQVTAEKFFSFLSESGIDTHDYKCLDIGSGPAAAILDLDTVSAACRALDVPAGTALLIPDTAIPAMHWIEPLELGLDRPVLTANQVSLWHSARLAGVVPEHPQPGRLFSV